LPDGTIDGYDPGQPVVRGNPAQLETAMSMLIQNSVEALPSEGAEGKRIVHLKTKVWKGRVRLKVADSGGGVDKETLRQAFRPFFTTKETGNGLGLAVAAGITRCESK
jgi:C4-dicarboxylate-specific signal transduction histidine kinase